MRLLGLALGVVVLLYAALLALLWWGQERLIFQPTRLPAEHRFAFGPDVHERHIDVDGARLSALHLKLPAPRGLVFYLHGNAGNLDSWFVNADFWRQANVDLFMIDYRGYGKSSGRIESEAQLHADVRAAWDQLAPRYAGLRRVLLGRSLGSGLAARLAADLSGSQPPDLTVLISPYASLERVAREHFPWVPPQLLRYPLRTDRLIGRIRGPILLLHGGLDNVIPPAHARDLQLLAPTARLHLVPQAAHNDLQAFDDYLAAIADALRGP